MQNLSLQNLMTINKLNISYKTQALQFLYKNCKILLLIEIFC